jgi:hypothetical protein
MGQFLPFWSQWQSQSRKVKNCHERLKVQSFTSFSDCFGLAAHFSIIQGSFEEEVVCPVKNVKIRQLLQNCHPNDFHDFPISLSF